LFVIQRFSRQIHEDGEDPSSTWGKDREDSDKEDPDNEELHEGVYIPSGHNASRTTENIAEQILGLEDLPETKRMRAVEYAAKRIRRDIAEPVRNKLTSAIFLNCQSGKKYPYKVLDIDGFSERGFYRERDKFLVDIAIFLELV